MLKFLNLAEEADFLDGATVDSPHASLQSPAWKFHMEIVLKKNLSAFTLQLL